MHIDLFSFMLCRTYNSLLLRVFSSHFNGGDDKEKLYTRESDSQATFLQSAHPINLKLKTKKINLHYIIYS